MNKKLFIFLCAAIPLSVVIYGVILLVLTWPVKVLSIANAGVFGDSFGVLTSLFSALAFLGVVLTLAYQREEFKLQKIELEENRKEMKKQGFENCFFQMLKLHNDILSSLTISEQRINGVKTYDGRAVIQVMMAYLQSNFQSYGYYKEVVDINDIRNVYEKFYQERGYLMAHYLRFLYNIFKYISESDVEDKQIYSRLARAQISNEELYIIYYNALTKRGYKFKKYIIEFELMDNLHPKQLFSPEHQHLIPKAGFKSETEWLEEEH